jgi:hypothetical protein
LVALGAVTVARFILYQRSQRFEQARLIKITQRRLAIRLDPFRMLGPEIRVNLFTQIGVRLDVVNHIKIDSHSVAPVTPQK